MTDPPFRFFDRSDDYVVIERRLPHWSQPGTLCFITFRTADSLPKHVLQHWLQERNELLLRHGINPSAADWKQQLKALPQVVQIEVEETLSDKWHQNLDACHGACVLQQPELSDVVATSLMKFDGERYELTDFVIMPNHVHLLAAFLDQSEMLRQCESWKHFTAHAINRHIGQRGRFWQQDCFDHLVRSEEQFHWLRRYIAQNPEKASLTTGSARHYSREL